MGDAQLLVCDSFSHESEGSEETQLRLDLIRFPRPVTVSELRVIPNGCPMHPQLTIATKVGKTAPSSFKLEIFVKNLNQPSVAVMEKFGVLEYDEASRFRIKSKEDIPTDAVVLRGWYANISVAIYGRQTEVTALENEASKAQHSEVSPTKALLVISPKSTRKSPSPMVGIQTEITKPIVLDEATGGDVDQFDRKAIEETAIGDFEPIASPEHDDDFEEMAGGRQLKAKEYEAIESDEDIPDEIDIADFGQDGDVDFNVYSEDAWMSVSVSFNPYQCDLLPLQSMSLPYCSAYELALQKLQETTEQTALPEKAQQLLDSICDMKAMDFSPRWVAGLEDILSLLEDGLASLVFQKPDEGICSLLVEWTVQALDIVIARKQPVAVNIRQLKAGMAMVTALSRCGDNFPELLTNTGVMEQLCHLLEEPFMATTMKLAAITAIDGVTNFAVGMEMFLGWHESGDVTEGRTLYQRLVELLLTKQTPRVVTAGAALLQKVNIYECLATLQQTVDRWTSASIPDSTVVSPQETWKTAWMDNTGVDQVKQDENDNCSGDVQEEPTVKDEDDPDSDHVRAVGHTQQMDGSESEDTIVVVADEPMDTGNDMVETGDQLKKTVSFNELDGDMKPMMTESAVLPYDVETIVECLTNLLTAVKNAADTVQLPANCLPMKSKFLEVPKQDPYPNISRLFKSRRLMEVLLVLVSSPHLVNHAAIFSAVRDLLLFLIGFQDGLLYLASDSGTANEIIRVLTQATEEDIPYTRAPTLSELFKEGGIVNCTAQCLGLLLIYYLQALQAVDLITYSSKENSGDLDSADVLSTLHTLYSMTFTAIGKEAVVSVLSWVDNIKCLLPFVEQQGNSEHDDKVKKSVSSRYAAVLILLTVQGNGDGLLLERYGDRLLALSAGEHNNLSLTDLADWMSPLKCLANVGVKGPIPALVEQLQIQVEDLSTTKILSELPAVITILRLLKYYGCPSSDLNGEPSDLKWSVATIALFSANAMEAIIRFLQKLNAGLTRPRRQGQLTASQNGTLVFATAQPLLLLVKTMLSKLFDTSAEFRDSRLLSGLFGLHVILCSVMPAGSLASVAQEVHTDIVEIISLFASPSLSKAVSDDISKTCWCLMLQELLKHTLEIPQNFYSGLVLLSELLPLPLPLHTEQELSDKEKERLVHYRHLWAIHILGVQSRLEDVLTALTESTCPTLMQVFRRVTCQVADLSGITAQMITRLFMTTADERLAGEGEAKLSPAKPLEILSDLITMASFKAGVLDCLQSDADLLLPKLLAQLNCNSDDGTKNDKMNSHAVYFLQSLCDAYINLASGLNMNSQQLCDSIPDASSLSLVCEALVEHLTVSGASLHTQLSAIRIAIGLAEHECGFTHLAKCLDGDNETFSSFLNSLVQKLEGLSDSLSEELSDSSSRVLSAVGAVLELIHVLGSKPVKETILDLEGEDEIVDSQPALRTSYLKPVQLRVLLSWAADGQEHEEHVLLCLMKKIGELDVEEEHSDLLKQFNAVIALLKSSETEDDQPIENDKETIAQLPGSRSISEQFAERTIVVRQVADERPDLDFWFGAFAPISESPEPYMVKCNLEELAQKCCGDFSLKDEIEKWVVKSPPQSPTRDKKDNKRKVDPLIAESVAKRPRPSDTMMFTGRGYGGPRRGKDFFRLRQQNTSRPPSMHVDDFTAIDNSLKPRKMDNRARGHKWMSGQQAAHPYMGRGTGDYGQRWMEGHRGPADVWGYRPAGYPTRGPGWAPHYHGDQYGRPGQWQPGKDDRRFGVAPGMYGHMTAGWQKRGHDRGFGR
ncbi:protein virilizer homolog isoform X2 [Corticium candelabrum]|uniref:protein virilizer homolog isoform X2 n=1 Tax=Corticium candelabrum TaxID=121492 RepID=UPI002E257E53|nr:protein virilizer homolog isoform X2 [Corticium candelabrum]